MSKQHIPQRIGSIVESILEERGYLTVCKEYDMQRQWPHIVGEKIAEVTECTRVEKGILYVRVNSASWRQELVYIKERLLSEIRKKCHSIKNIIFY